MAKENNDAKPNAEASSAATDDKEQTTESSTAANTEQTPNEKGESLADIVQKTFDESLSKEQGADGEGSETASTEKEEVPAEVKEETSPAKTEETQEPPKVDERDKDVKQEYHKDPAWQRIIHERNDAEARLKAMEGPSKFAEGVTSYCRANQITDQQFKEALGMVSLINTDPKTAYEKMQGVMKTLEEAVGAKLPSDLEAKVKEGVLDPETAAEVARLRAEKKLAEGRQVNNEQRAAQANIASQVQALNDWDASKAKTDPDFAKKTELIRGRWLALFQATGKDGQPLNPIRSPADVVALAERAYAEVNKDIAAFIPQKPARRTVSSNGSSTRKTETAPGSLKESVNAMLREKYKISLGEEEE